MIKMAYYLLFWLSGDVPETLTRLFSSVCLLLHGAAIWNLSNPSPRSLEVAFNNTLWKIWHLPFNCHTRIPHLAASLVSPFDLIYCQSQSPFISATTKSPSSIVHSVFSSSVNLCYWLQLSLCWLPHETEDVCRAEVIRYLRLFGTLSWTN
jgi:hypothetical protein